MFESAKIKELEKRIKVLEEMVDVFCEIYYQENKEQIESRSSYVLGHYFGEDKIVVNRAKYVQAKNAKDDAERQMRRAKYD